jgi:hypothetical protein
LRLIDTAPPRDFQQSPKIVIGNEVRVGDIERSSRTRDGQRVESLGGCASARWRRVENAGLHAAWDADERRVGKEAATGNQFSGTLRPCRGERRLQRHHGGTFESHVAVAPLIRVSAVAQPVVGQAEPAGVRNLAIHNGYAHVRTITRVVQGVPV